MKYKKGDIVSASHFVLCQQVSPLGNGMKDRIIERLEHKKDNLMVVGYSTRYTGEIIGSGYRVEYDDPPYLRVRESHRVVMCVDGADEHRYYAPMAYFEDDLTPSQCVLKEVQDVL